MGPFLFQPQDPDFKNSQCQPLQFFKGKISILFSLLCYLMLETCLGQKKKKGTDLGMPLNPLPLTTVVDKRKLYCSSLPDIGHSGGALLEESNLINISDGNIH